MLYMYIRTYTYMLKNKHMHICHVACSNWNNSNICCIRIVSNCSFSAETLSKIASFSQYWPMPVHTDTPHDVKVAVSQSIFVNFNSSFHFAFAFAFASAFVVCCLLFILAAVIECQECWLSGIWQNNNTAKANNYTKTLAKNIYTHHIFV